MIAVAAGVASGLVFIAPASGTLIGLVLVNLTHLPLFLVGLGFGVTAATIAAASATALVGLALEPSSMLPYLVAFAVPAVVIVRQSLQSRTAADGTVEWYPPGHLLSILAVYGAAVFVVATVMLTSESQGLEELIGATLDEGLAHFFPEMPEAQRLAVAAHWSATFPAMIVMSWLFTIVANAVLSQSILVRSGRNLRPSPRYGRLEAPNALVFGVAGSGILWFAASGTIGYVGKILAIVLATPYFFQGLAVVHQLSRTWIVRMFLLVIFYFLLMFILGWPGLVLVAGLGFVEQWVGLRRRFASAPPGEEEG